MENVICTGGTGTIGRALPKEFRRLQLRLDSKTNYAAFREDFKDATLVHLAGVVGESNVRQDLQASYDVNVTQTRMLAKTAFDCGLKKLVFVSSGHVYGPREGLAQETDSPNPVSSYGEQKLDAEIGLIQELGVDADRLVIARVFSVLDNGMPKKSLGGLLSEMVQGRKQPHLSSSADVRDFLDLASISELLGLLAKSNASSQLINLCSGQGRSIQEAAKQILDLSGFPIDTLTFDETNSTFPRLVGSNARLLKDFPSLQITWNPRPLD